ncbi:MAG TPA: RDD family protein [Vicinamibacterales bacterium]|nr:RDD family protein [Vicinamibacterales bacterium]
MTDVGAEVDNLLGESDLAASATHRVGASENPANRVRRGVAASPGELPLFGKPIPDDQPLITRASPPRAPLAVRRSTPDVPRVRAEAPRAATLDLALDVDGDVAADPVYAAQVESSEAVPSAGTDPRDAPVAARFLAVVVDIGILAVIDAVVVYFTAQICGIALTDLNVLPKGPLIAFLLVQNGGYLVAFTAGGQTLGKMLAGIRVVATESTEPLDLGRALVRTALWVLLAVPAGLGFLSAVLSHNHRGLHDRFAGTRVVRA